jgi:hypothetical protein
MEDRVLIYPQNAILISSVSVAVFEGADDL